jgi:hypothetical protein
MAAADAGTENYLHTYLTGAFTGINLFPQKRPAGAIALKFLGLNLYD